MANHENLRFGIFQTTQDTTRLTFTFTFHPWNAFFFSFFSAWLLPLLIASGENCRRGKVLFRAMVETMTTVAKSRVEERKVASHKSENLHMAAEKPRLMRMSDRVLIMEQLILIAGFGKLMMLQEWVEIFNRKMFPTPQQSLTRAFLCQPQITQ